MRDSVCVCVREKKREREKKTGLVPNETSVEAKT